MTGFYNPSNCLNQKTDDGPTIRGVFKNHKKNLNS